ncbi:YhcN/YlaJ family sporulation lipoprotein [Wukongibacter sp. M2B1]|uniref:YhcN/YlaJ family sporulation lipoprotein n=1 Tax=Wukongibacter sp. M2B1 TaxID=3088895 RepID=UPI003D7B6EDF
MGDNKLRVITLVLSLVLITSAFIVGCTTPETQERPVPDNKYGTRYYMENDRYTTRYGTNYGVTDNTKIGNNYGQNYTPDNRLYGFFDTGNNTRGFGYDNISGDMRVPSRTGTNSTQVRQMENSCNNIKGVTDATVVKNEDTAYVGLDTNQATNENVAALRTECANRIKKIDPSVKKVVVTVDPSKLSKLKNMVRDINVGRPARGFMTDLENLFR